MGDGAYRPDTRYQEASVARSRLRVPVKIIIGSEDPIVSFEQVAPFAPLYVSIAAGAGHFDLIHPQTNAFSLITSTVEVLSSNAGGSER
jgi:pimeloyl-ACP methyl ester carboxylesterase